MANIETALRSYVLSSATIASLVSSRMYYLIAPQEGPFPYIVYHDVDDPARWDAMGNTPTRQPRFQFDVYGSTASSVVDVREALIDRLRQGQDYYINNIIYGACTDAANAPKVINKTPAGATNCTFAYSADRLATDGFGSYKLTKTTSAGSGIATYRLDAYSSSDMLYLAAGGPVAFSFYVYIPSSGGPIVSRVFISEEEYYSAAWNGNIEYGTALSQDTWSRMTRNLTVNASATGVSLYFGIISAAPINQYIYVRNFMLEPSTTNHDFISATGTYANTSMGSVVASTIDIRNVSTMHDNETGIYRSIVDAVVEYQEG